MKSKVFLAVLSTGLMLSQSVYANEVGNKNFVVEPKAAPVFVSKGGTRMWPCEGMVNPSLIKIVYDEIRQISDLEKIQKPDPNLCLWKRGKFSWGGNSVDTYTIQFYLDRGALNACTVLDNCQEIRSMDFKMVNGSVHRQYLLTSAPRRLTRMACISGKGEVVKLKGGC